VYGIQRGSNGVNPGPQLNGRRKQMTELTNVEQLEIHGGTDWGQFLGDVGLGIGFAVCIYTGNVLGAIATGSAIAAQIYNAM
jgi:hypothetical protein